LAVQPYKVALIQQETKVIVNPADRDSIIEQNLDRIFELVQWTFNRVGEVRLAAFSEYGIIGQYRPWSVDRMARAGGDHPRPGHRSHRRRGSPGRVPFRGQPVRARRHVARSAAEHQLHHRRHARDHPEVPEEQIILKYPKKNGPNNLNATHTGSGDVYDENAARHGEQSMCPVVDTPLGVLGTLTCTDVIFPEMARALALQGAEVLIHPTAEPWSDVDPMWDVFRRYRACENLAYFLSVCVGAFVGSDRPRNGYRGHSQIVDHMDRIVAIAEGSGEAVCVGTVDVNALREVRSRKPGKSGYEWNQVVDLRTDLFAEVYKRANRWPNNYWADNLLQSTEESRAKAREMIDDLVSKGLLKLPDYS
jgi:hypothetical protein